MWEGYFYNQYVVVCNDEAPSPETCNVIRLIHCAKKDMKPPKSTTQIKYIDHNMLNLDSVVVTSGSELVAVVIRCQ